MPDLAAVFQIGSLGDTIVSVPLLRSLRELIPNCTEYLLVSRFDSHSNVMPNQVFDMAWRPKHRVDYLHRDAGLRGVISVAELLAKLRYYRPRHCVYLMPTLRSARQIERDKLFFKLGGVTNLLGFRPLAKPEMAKNNGPYLETTEAFRRFARVWGTEAIDKFAEYSAGPLLTPGENAHRRVTEWLAASRRHPARPLVAVCPYSNCTSKNIPAACIPDLIYQLEAELKLEVVIMGGRKDAAEADNAVRQSGVGLNACGAFSIEESAALLKSCRLAVAADSGPMHLAGAVGVPLIAVFSRYDSPLGKWFPLGVDNTILFRDVECAGCRAAACPVQGHPCMSDIKVDHIVAAVAGKIFGLSVLPSSLNGTRMVDWTSEVSVRQ